MRHGVVGASDLRWGARVAAVLAATAAVLVGTAGPADAHTISTDPPTNYQSVLLGISPPVPGVTLRVRQLGTLVEVSNTTATDLVILGYEGEPFLRVGPSGIFRNAASPTVYQNQVTVYGAQAIYPPGTSAAAPPVWQRIGDGHVVRWRDQRTRHEGPTPAIVVAAPHEVHNIGEWTLPMRYGSSSLVGEGLLRWVPAPDPWPWIAAALGLAALVGVLSVLGGTAPIVVALAVLLSVNLAQTVATSVPAANSLAELLVRVAILNWFAVVATVVGVVAIVTVARSADALFLVAFSAGCVMLFGGASNVSVLDHSQIAYAVGPPVGRIMVTVSLGAGAGLVVASILRVRRSGVRPPADARRPAPAEPG